MNDLKWMYLAPVIGVNITDSADECHECCQVHITQQNSNISERLSFALKGLTIRNLIDECTLF